MHAVRVALEVNFLGGVGSGRAPLVTVRRNGATEPLPLSERARLLVAFLALEARAPESVKREAVQRRVFAGRPANDIDEAKDELKLALDGAGLGEVFRPYRQDADDKASLDPRGRLALRDPVRCDLADLLALFSNERFAEAAELLSEITKRQGDCQPLELVELECVPGLAPDERWYRDRADRLALLMREHRHAIERARTTGAEDPGPIATAKQAPPPRRRGRVLVVLAVAALAAIAAGTVALSAGEDASGDPCPTSMTRPSDADLEARRIGSSEPGPARPLPPVVVRSRPRSIAVGSDGIWVTQSIDGSVWLIDPRIEQPVGEPIPVGGVPYAIALAEDVVWVTREDGSLVAIDRETRRLRPEVYPYGAESAEVTLGGGSVWVNNYADRYTGMVTRIDPCSGEVDRIEVGAQANTVRFAYGAVWVSDSLERALHRVDPETHRVTDILLPLNDPQDVGAGGGYIWPVFYGPKRVVRVDPETNRVVGPLIRIGAGAAGAVVAGGALWLPNYEGNSITRVDLKTLRSDPHAARVGISPTDVASGFGRIWVTNNDSEPPSVAAIRP